MNLKRRKLLQAIHLALLIRLQRLNLRKSQVPLIQVATQEAIHSDLQLKSLRMKSRQLNQPIHLETKPKRSFR
jgi:hypothetical protein